MKRDSALYNNNTSNKSTYTSKQQLDGSIKTSVSYKLVYFGTCSQTWVEEENVVKWCEGINQGLHQKNDWFVKNAYTEATKQNVASKSYNDG